MWLPTNWSWGFVAHVLCHSLCSVFSFLRSALQYQWFRQWFSNDNYCSCYYLLYLFSSRVGLIIFHIFLNTLVCKESPHFPYLEKCMALMHVVFLHRTNLCVSICATKVRAQTIRVMLRSSKLFLVPRWRSQLSPLDIHSHAYSTSNNYLTESVLLL